MHRSILNLSLLLIVSSAEVSAKQPISESLVDCATIFSMTTRAFPERNTAKSAALKSAEKTLLAEAENKARAEGNANAPMYVAALANKKQQKWDARGVNFIFSDEFRDWTSYCRSLSKHLGIELQ